jgi:riboflavin kinase/FMN adenylyltransferase
MKLLHGFDDPQPYRGGFISIGNFDGVHLGHQSMIIELVRRARAAGKPAVVFTFDPHPIILLRPDHAPPSLSILERKVELLCRCGVDCVIAYPTSQDLLNLTPDQFFQKIVVDELQASGLVEGPNFFFGRNRAGDISKLERLCDRDGLSLKIVSQVEVDSRMVSSSVIRSLIIDGQIAAAVKLLGHAYQIQGTVRPGAGRGKSIGFPTANLEEVATLVPSSGVYAGIATLDDSSFPAAINVGPNPTFQDERCKVEVHIVGFDGDLYGHQLKVEFLDRIRDTVAFADVDALRNQLTLDVERTCTIAKDQIAQADQ